MSGLGFEASFRENVRDDVQWKKLRSPRRQVRVRQELPAELGLTLGF